MPIAIHGHFYQPPRENPWTGAIDAQPDAAPWHDWNERVYQEAYRPNAFCSIPTPRGNRVVNNLERISFNFGPTLMSWLEQMHPETHTRVVEADQKSLDRLGHGNAIAQAFHHTILPLSPLRDIRTEVRWGLADFRFRFEREPEGMWLPETAASPEVLSVLIEEGVGFTILAPWQAAAWRDRDGEWRDTAASAIDTRLAYRYLHPDGSGRSIALFFYDGDISQAIAFEKAGSSAERFLDLFARMDPGEARLVHAATDGETYGHHHKFSDLGLAYALYVEAERRGLEVTNYGVHLERFPPRREVRFAEGGATSWSCTHGVERWRSDCGCSTGGEEGWNQAWRGPLRTALEIVKATADDLFEDKAGDQFRASWDARDRYVDVVIGAQSAEKFLAAEAARPLTDEEAVESLLLLELQRLALSMFTSCGWFFADIGGIETVQVLRYAARTLELIAAAGGNPPRADFEAALAEAVSNDPEQGTGAEIFAAIARSARG